MAEIKRRRARFEHPAEKHTRKFNEFESDNVDEFVGGPKLAVMGVGGGGNNALNNLCARADLQHVKMIVCNTDIQDLKNSICPNKIQLGPQVTQGLGAGGNPMQGALAAEESMDEIMDSIEGCHMLFIAGGMGGGTGTGGLKEIASVAKEEGMLVVAIVTQPFAFEGAKRMKVAVEYTKLLQKHADILVVIPNNNVLRIANANTSIQDAFASVDNVLASFVGSITRIITRPGLVNIDFADVKAALYDMCARAMIGIGEAEGDNRGLEAAEQALSSPLLEECSLQNARSVIVSVEGGADMTLLDVSRAVDRIQQEVMSSGDENSDCKFFFGASFDEELAGKLRVTVLATLLSPEHVHEQKNKANQTTVAGGAVEKPAMQDVSYASEMQNMGEAGDLLGMQHDNSSMMAAHEERAQYDHDLHWWKRFAGTKDAEQKRTGVVKNIAHDELFCNGFTDGSEFIRRKKQD